MERAWARSLDSQSLTSWIRRGAVTDGGLDLLNVLLGSAFGGSATDASALFGLWYVAGAGNEYTAGTVERMIGVRGAAQDSRFHGGAQMLSLRLADELGDAVALGEPVRRVEQDGRGVRVFSDNREWSASRAVVAVPPALASRIAWDPLLPAQQDALFSRMALGTLCKIEAVYPEPFWRKDGLSGQGVFRDPTSPVCSMFDNSPPDGGPGILMGFVGGAQWRRWVSLPPVSAAERCSGPSPRSSGSRRSHPSSGSNRTGPRKSGRAAARRRCSRPAWSPNWGCGGTCLSSECTGPVRSTRRTGTGTSTVPSVR